MNNRSAGLIAAAGVSALLVAGCGGTSKSSSTSSTAAVSSSNPYAAAAAKSTTAAAKPVGESVAVTVKHAGKLGTILAVGVKRLTVYMFEGDSAGASSCSGTCAAVWPPVTTDAPPKVSGSASSADIGTITRSDGTTQVTYKGHPLYYFAKDKDSGDAYGQGVKGFGASWYVLAPSGRKVDNS